MRLYDINLSTSLVDRPEGFSNFNAFFTRALQPGARPIAGGESVASPVDGFVSAIGTVQQNSLLQVKGRTYSLNQLVPQSHYADRFQNGRFATLYLSPKDYHRVHMPVDGVLRETTYQPGRLFAVNPASVRVVKDLFCRNERVACLFETASGCMAVILVGAFFVGSIETVWHGAFTPPHGNAPRRWDHDNGARRFLKGDELGLFKMGSTVILLFESDRVAWDAGLGGGDMIRMGQSLGRISAPAVPEKTM